MDIGGVVELGVKKGAVVRNGQWVERRVCLYDADNGLFLDLGCGYTGVCISLS